MAGFKPDEFAKLVNDLVQTIRQYHCTQQLRERVKTTLIDNNITVYWDSKVRIGDRDDCED